jgi:hypothetical protein
MKLTAEQTKELTELFSEAWGKDTKMIEHCLKSTKYIKVGNTFISVCQAKPKINNQMWYDDTQENPGKSFQRFYDYNIKNVQSEMKINRCAFGWDDKLFLIPKNWKTPNMKLCQLTYNESDSDFAREVTEEELLLINAAIREVREDYTKRLEAYYKKYSDKIYSSGYWVDR